MSCVANQRLKKQLHAAEQKLEHLPERLQQLEQALDAGQQVGRDLPKLREMRSVRRDDTQHEIRVDVQRDLGRASDPEAADHLGIPIAVRSGQDREDAGADVVDRNLEVLQRR